MMEKRQGFPSRAGIRYPGLLDSLRPEMYNPSNNRE
jgi:hypothetical protein